MVDALRQAHRAVRPGGTLIDLRPDSDRPARVTRGGRVVGRLREHPEATADSHFSDRAVERVVRDGLFAPIRRGHFSYEMPAMDLPELDAFLAQSRRLAGYTRGTRARLATEPDRPIVVRRGLTYGIYRRV